MPWDVIAKIALLILLDLILLGGLIGIPLGLSGNFIILGAALVVGIVTKFHAVSLWAIGGMAAFVVLGEIIEAFLGSAMARRYGASKWGMIGAFAGGIAGAIIGTPILPVIGSIIGSFAGAAVGAILLEWIHLRRLRESMPSGGGAFLGKLSSTLIKMAIGLAMVIYIVIQTH